MNLLKIASRVAAAPSGVRTAMKLTLKSEKGRRQVWDLDGKEVRSLAGDGHVETSGEDPAANKVVEDFIRGAYPGTDFPKVGESVGLPKVGLSATMEPLSPKTKKSGVLDKDEEEGQDEEGQEDPGPPSERGPDYDTLEEKKGLK